jgi:hypothetical protein
MARIIAPLSTGSTIETRRARRVALTVVFVIARAMALTAHDLEKTRVTLTFARDGTFVLDVANDPDWLKLRLERFSGPFADRVVLWVDGREIRPTSEEYVAPPPVPPGEVPNLGVHRMRGTMPHDAKALRWYYGLVIDPYPMTIRRADGKIAVEEIQGDAWSGTIDLARQFPSRSLSTSATATLFVALLLIPALLRLAWNSPRRHEVMKKI